MRSVGYTAGSLILALVGLSGCSSTGGGAPSFSLEPAAQTLTVEAGDQTSLWVALERTAGFTQTVRMSLKGLPDGAEQSWSRDTPDGDCSLTLRLDPEVAPGTYALELIGEAEGVGAGRLAPSGVRPSATVTQTVTLQVQPALQLPRLSLTVNPAILTLKRNSVGEFNIQITRQGGFGGEFRMQVVGPNQFFAGIPNPGVVNDGTNSAIFRFATQVGSAPGTLLLELQALRLNSSEVIAKAPLRIDITQEVAPPSVELTAGPLSVQLGRGGGGGGAQIFVGVVRHNFPDPVDFKLTDPSGDISGNFVLGKRDGDVQVAPDSFSLFPKPTAALGVHPLTLQLLRRSNGEVLATRTDLQATVVPVSGEEDFFLSNARQVSMPAGFQAARGMFVQPDKKIVLGGTLDGKFRIQRHNPDGSPDAAFGSGGVAVANFGGSPVKLSKIVRDPFNGGIMAVGTFDSGTGIAVARFTSAGVPDGGFSGDGLLSSSFMNEASDAVVIRGNVFAVVGGTFGSATECRILVLTRTATPDTSFSGDGQQSVNPSTSTDACFAASSAGTGLLIAGSANKGVGNDFKFFLARLGEGGSLDEGFGDKGQVFTDVNDATDVIRAVVRQANGKFLAGGSGPAPVLARYNASGSPDTAFGTGGTGVAVLTSPVQSGEVRALALDGSNRILVATAGNQLVRLNSAGALDTGFASNGVKGTGGAARALALDDQGRILVLTDSRLERLFP